MVVFLTMQRSIDEHNPYNLFIFKQYISVKILPQRSYQQYIAMFVVKLFIFKLMVRLWIYQLITLC